MACLLSITSAYSQIPLGSGKGGFFINFFSNGNNSTTCQRDFCMHLFSGIDFLLAFFPSLLDALEVGSFVSLAELCWAVLCWAGEKGSLGH